MWLGNIAQPRTTRTKMNRQQQRANNSNNKDKRLLVVSQDLLLFNVATNSTKKFTMNAVLTPNSQNQTMKMDVLCQIDGVATTKLPPEMSLELYNAMANEFLQNAMEKLEKDMDMKMEVLQSWGDST
jgi:hypothetical protein